LAPGQFVRGRIDGTRRWLAILERAVQFHPGANQLPSLAVGAPTAM
jgi:hypothetical protein